IFVFAFDFRNCACKTELKGVRNVKKAARAVRRRRVFISVFILVRLVESGFKRSQRRRDSLTIAPRMSSLFFDCEDPGANAGSGSRPLGVTLATFHPRVQYFDWTVPNAPTNQPVLDIRF